MLAFACAASIMVVIHVALYFAHRYCARDPSAFIRAYHLQRANDRALFALAWWVASVALACLSALAV